MTAAYRRGRGGCVQRDLRLGIAGPEAREVRRVEFRLARRLVIRDAVPPFKATIKRSRLRRGARFRIRATVRLLDGRSARLGRTMRACR
jgi:hypothetical protein